MSSVLILTPWFPNHPGDRQGNYIYDSAAALARAGTAVNVVVTRPFVPRGLERFKPAWEPDRFEHQSFLEFAGTDLVHYPSIPRNHAWRFSEWAHDLCAWPILERRLSEQHCDIIHAHCESEARVAVGVGAKLGIPVVVTLHGINMGARYFDIPERRKRFRAALAAANRVILVGEPLRPYFHELVGRNDHFRTVFNGVQMPQPKRQKPVLGEEDEIAFVSVANLHEGKGVDIALKALASARTEGFEDWTYTIVGGGVEGAALTALCTQLGLNDKVKFMGARPHSEIQAFLDSADVFLLPSYREAFGVAYLEAMAAGLLAIGVRGQGPQAFIANGKTGILVEPQSVDDLARHILTIRDQRREMRAMTACGMEAIRRDFTWDRHADNLRDLYNDVVSQSAA